MRVFLSALILIVLMDASAAPVPPPPPLTKAKLVGKWDITFSESSFEGEITFGDDGTYEVVFQKGNSKYGGNWWIAIGNGVVLLESGKRADGSTYVPNQYRFTLDPQTLEGKTPEGWPVKLAKPK